MSSALGAALTGRLALLVASMRAGGARIGIDGLLAAHRALVAVDPSDREAAYFALRSALCSRRSDLMLFDAAFAAAFGSRREVAPPPEPGALEEIGAPALPRAALPFPSPAPAPEELDLDPVPVAWSDVEVLRQKDFAHYSDAERALARRIMASLAQRGPRRGSPPHASRPDLRRTVRAALRYGGEPVERHWRRPSDRPRPVVLVCDISGSMASYSRMLLQYMQACVAARRRVEAFVFGTRLTRVTVELESRNPDRALDRATAAAHDWSGGTRIGDALATLNREHGRRLGRGAVVVLLSDGWDQGDPALLSGEMARLRRCAHRVVWLNPLKADPAYEPLTRGMRAALPHVDHFLAGNSLASLEELAELMEKGIG
jgi:uncharacterized protein